MQLFGKCVLRIIFVRKVKEVTVGWSRQGSEYLHDFYTSLKIVIVTKTRNMI